MKRTSLLTIAAFFFLGVFAGAFAQPLPPPDQNRPRDAYGNPSDGGNPPPTDQGAGRSASPSRIMIQQGTYVTVRINQGLSSDRNQQGDAFFASLAAPLVVNGVVVAQRGQTVVGRVSEAERAGRTQGTSRLALQLTELTLADGQQVPVETELVTRHAMTSVGRDAGTVATATVVGAVVGAGADRGRGAAIGAGVGAAAGIVGVLLTRGNATAVYPESVLTFRLERPVDIDTSRGAQAFRYADSRDYERQPGPASYDDGFPPPPGRGDGRRYGGSVYGPGWTQGLSIYIGRGYYGGYGRRGRRW